jgi:DmsE family decaheme c-type cytochrome
LLTSESLPLPSGPGIGSPGTSRGSLGFLRRSARASIRAAAALCGAALLGLCPPAAGPAVAQAGYVGEEVCGSCHEDLLSDYSHTIHAKVLNATNAPTAAGTHGCESCHGPGGMHVDAGGGPGTGGPDFLTFRGETAAAREAENAKCLSCHEGGEQRFWHGSPHESRGRSCAECHNVMKQVSSENLLAKPTETALCSQCHHLNRARMMRSSHMPARKGALGEGWMDCGTCHNPHGTVTRSLIDASSVNENCYGCHAEKRGPFLWEHAPVNENCLNCHDPHGSINAHMLKLAPPRLCQTCHIESLHPSEARLPGSRFTIGKGCMQCHQKVHGSNHPSGFAFTR